MVYKFEIKSSGLILWFISTNTYKVSTVNFRDTTYMTKL